MRHIFACLVRLFSLSCARVIPFARQHSLSIAPSRPWPPPLPPALRRFLETCPLLYVPYRLRGGDVDPVCSTVRDSARRLTIVTLPRPPLFQVTAAVQACRSFRHPRPCACAACRPVRPDSPPWPPNPTPATTTMATMASWASSRTRTARIPTSPT